MGALNDVKTTIQTINDHIHSDVMIRHWLNGTVNESLIEIKDKGLS